MPPQAATKPCPLILYLHGSSESGSDNLKQINVTIDNLLTQSKQRGAFLYAPQTANNWSGIAITDRVMTMLHRVVADQNVEPTQVYAMGFSLGGGVWNMLSRYDQEFAAAVPVSGVAPATDFLAPKLTDTPIWAFHSRNDSVVPVAVTRDVVTDILAAAEQPAPTYPPIGDPSDFYFNNLNLDLQYNELGTAGHNIWFGVSRIPRIYDWLFAHSLAVPEPNASAILLTAAAHLLARRPRRSVLTGRDRTATI
jgi:predicted peptidase